MLRQGRSIVCHLLLDANASGDAAQLKGALFGIRSYSRATGSTATRGSSAKVLNSYFSTDRVDH
jgi:hypothetical protein